MQPSAIQGVVEISYLNFVESKNVTNKSCQPDIPPAPAVISCVPRVYPRSRYFMVY